MIAIEMCRYERSDLYDRGLQVIQLIFCPVSFLLIRTRCLARMHDAISRFDQPLSPRFLGRAGRRQKHQPRRKRPHEHHCARPDRRCYATEARGDRLFNNAVALKRAGDVAGAIKLLDQAFQTQPNYLAGQLARAGYQAVAGDAEGAQKMFDAIAVPEAADGKTFNEAGYVYHLNATWFHGLMGNDKGAIATAKKVLEQAPNGPTREPFAKYFASEPDLAHLRDNVEINALLKPPAAAATFDANANVFEANASVDFAAGASAEEPTTNNSPLNTRLTAVVPAKPAMAPEA